VPISGLGYVWEETSYTVTVLIFFSRKKMIYKFSVPRALSWSKYISCCVLPFLAMEQTAAFLSVNVSEILRSACGTIAVILCNGMSCFVAPDFNLLKPSGKFTYHQV
jgi:hypothetical protein